MDDDLTRLWQQQEEFMKLLQKHRSFPQFPVDLESKPGQQSIKGIAHDCMHEIFEAIHLLKNSKNHRKTEVVDIDRESFLEECVDAQKFLWEMLILAGFSRQEFIEAYLKKGDVNTARIEGGY